MRWLAILLGLSACAPSPVPVAGGRAQRIVSLDYCADQYVLKLVSRSRILAVSPDATSDFSYMRGSAQGVRQVRARAEDLLLLKPDLVVRSYGGGPGIADPLERAGIRVVQLGYASDLAGVRTVLTDVAAALGEPERGGALAREWDTRLGALRAGAGQHSALYVTPGGVTTGPGSLVDEMLRAGGLANFQSAPGWGPLPVERLAYDRPDVVAAAFFDTRWKRADPWSASGHPVVLKALQGRRAVELPGAWTACGGWFVLDAVEKLAAAAR